MKFSDLMCERASKGESPRLSLGRVAFWILFSAIIYRVLVGEQIGTDLVMLASVLLGYGGFKKYVAATNVGTGTATVPPVIKDPPTENNKETQEA